MATVQNSKLKIEVVYNETINNSSSIQKFSFIKDRRFREHYPGKIKTDFNTTLPGSFGKRSCSFGVGDRFNNNNRRGKSDKHS